MPSPSNGTTSARGSLRSRWRTSGRAAAVLGATASLCLTVLSTGSAPAVGDTPPPSDTVSRAPVTAEDLLSATAPQGLTRNVRFARPSGARRAPALNGRLRLAGSTMEVISDGPGGTITNPVDGKDTTYFPDVSIGFFTSGTHLVPVTQNVIRNGVLPRTRSYWDVIVQPGRVWTQRGDRGWHRASFPFALVNSIEGETHTGIALFLYRGRHVSHVRYQVVQQTGPFDVPEYFSAWGTSPASFGPGVRRLGGHRRDFRRSQRALWAQRPLGALRRHGASRQAIEGYRSFSDVISSAAVVGRTIYRSGCPTSAGPFPYCSAVRYGVWSVTKSAMNDVAMMRLAQRYGAGFLDQPIATYLPAARTAPGWADVTFADLANMASGHGPAGDGTCYLCDYTRWYLAPSASEKTKEALDYPRFAEPGTQYNYRDQDAYLLMAAQTAFLRSKEGPRATVTRMLQRQVYDRLGIRTSPANTTIDSGGRGMLMGAYGYYPTVDDLAKISRLFQNRGRWQGRQILDRQLVSRLYPAIGQVPTRSLIANADGSERYLYNWHLYRTTPQPGCTRYVPEMTGWGGNTVTSLPGPEHVTLIRMRNNWVGDATDPQVEINALASELTALCG